MVLFDPKWGARDPGHEDVEAAYTGMLQAAAESIGGDYLISKDQCKNGGWRGYGVFKNQGDCVSFVATGGRNRPSVP